MAKKPSARQRKAQDRKRKKRETAKRHAKAQATAGRSPQARMRRAGALPLRECFILDGWEERGLATVVISRDGPEGIAAGVFLVDLDCLGVKNCIATPDMSWDEYQHLRERLEEDAPLVPCDPAFARKLVEAGVSFAAELGFRPEKDYRLAREIFGDIDAAACEVEIECGDGGRPRYVQGPDDDAEAIVAHLVDRVGADGFEFIVDGGSVDGGIDSGFDSGFDLLLEHLLRRMVPPEWTQKDDAEVPEEDQPWWRLWRGEARLTAELLAYAIDRFDLSLLPEAWGDFTQWEEDRSDPSEWSSVWPAFADWLVYNWRPAPEEPEFLEAKAGSEAAECRPRPGKPLALEFLDVKGWSLDDHELRFLDEMSRQPRSYYEMLPVVADRGVVLQDLFSDREVEVRERWLTETLRPGEILFARVVEHDGVAMVCGCAPLIIPPPFRKAIVEIRDEIEASRSGQGEDALHESADELLRDTYLIMLEQVGDLQGAAGVPGARDFEG